MPERLHYSVFKLPTKYKSFSNIFVALSELYVIHTNAFDKKELVSECLENRKLVKLHALSLKCTVIVFFCKLVLLQFVLSLRFICFWDYWVDWPVKKNVKMI